MRILVVTNPLKGHFYPMVPTCWALRTAGHDVRVATSPAFGPVVAQTGMVPVLIGDDPPGAADPDPGQAVAMRFWEDGDAHDTRLNAAGWFGLAAAAMVRDVGRYARAWRPDLVVAEPLALAGAVAAAVAGCPLVRHRWGIDATTKVVTDATAAFRGTPEGGTAAGRAVGRSADMTIDPCPPSLQLAGLTAGRVCRYLPFNGAAAEPSELAGRRRGTRVCVTAGTLMSGTGGAELVRSVAATADRAGLDVIVAVGAQHQHLVTPLPGRARVLGSMPLDLVLPTCDVVVHHGGAGTTLSAAVHGVPQLVVPLWADNASNAAQLVARGNGLTAAADDGTATVGAALDALVRDPRHRRSAQQVSREIGELPPPASLVAPMERLARMRLVA